MGMSSLSRVEVCGIHSSMCPLYLSPQENPGFTSRSKGFSKGTLACTVEARGGAAVRCFSASLSQLHSQIEPFPQAVKLLGFLEPLSPALKLTPEKDSSLS